MPETVLQKNAEIYRLFTLWTSKGRCDMTIPLIPCPSCGFTLKPVWFLEKELDNHGIPTGRTRKACSCLLCDMCGYKETVDDSFDEPYK